MTQLKYKTKMKKLILILFLLIGYLSEAQVSRIYTVDKTIVDSKAYRKRVVADAGSIRTDNIEKAFRAMAIQNEIYENIQFAWFGESGYKHRIASATASFWSKLYSSKGTNDATQTTELNQPYLSGNIAPNERFAMKNTNGGTKSVTHTGIVVSGTYTVTTVEQTELTGKYVITHTELTTGTLTTITPSGRLAAKIIRSTALTTAQKLAESNFLRSIYPEIETVKIGSQDWATSNLDVVATPQGNVISNITENVNVEKITGGNFESGLIGTNTDGNGSISTWSLNTIAPITGIQDGRIVCTTAGTDRPFISWGITIPSGNYGKLSFKYKVNSGTAILKYVYANGAEIVNTVLTGTGTYTYFGKSNGAAGLFGVIYFTSNLFDVQIDDISVQEIGWAGSTELYDAIYSQTSGTVEQKTYAAVKASAMWCYYNNDPALGAIYGKLYNWYAAKLLQMDIDYYNLANPLTPWGYRVPTADDYSTLNSTLGGTYGSGAKLRKEGLNYWGTTNIGINNSSGFSALGCGYRDLNGNYSSLNTYYFILTSTRIDNTIYRNVIYDNISVVEPSAISYGFSIRLIKN